MKRSLDAMKAFVFAASVLTLGLSASASAGTVPVVSDTTWNVFDKDGQWLGLAQAVCLNATNPPNCPLNATPPPTQYGYPPNGWLADLSRLPMTARWIWAPNVTGASSPAALEAFTFESKFYLCDPPSGGTVSIAADNAAEVWVNGTLVPGSDTTSHSALKTFSVPAASLFGSTPLNIRPNVITVKASNAANPADCGSDQYKCNPAGVVLGASFEYSGNPTCAGYKGGAYGNGDVETLSGCPAGQTGTVFHRCVCGYWLPNENTCVTPPPTCTGNDGMVYRVDEKETVSCPAATPVGSASRKCVAKDTWGPQDNSQCSPPPTTCRGIGGAVFSVGQTEAVGPCTGTRVGSRTHTCRPDGTWTDVVDTCRLPIVCGNAPPGTCICGSRDGQTGVCAGGLDCGPLPIGDPDHPGRTPTLKTADFFCGDKPPAALGEACSWNGSCASGWCDSGWNTSNTRKCMPRPGVGRLNDWCSHNNQCASGRCGGLRQDLSGAWQPGHCSNSTSALGEFCSVNSDCASTYCDRGDGTSKTSMCMPRGGAGRAGDWCSNHNQCASRVCGGLQGRADGSWQPGHCN